MSFFRSFFGTCCGPYIFNSLRKNSSGRVLWHLFLLCLLCAIGVGIGNFLMVRYKWRAAYNDFNDIYGTGVVFTERGILPKKAPEISRRQELPYESLIIYVSPDSKAEEYSDETLEKRNIIFFWSSACIAAFIRNGDQWQKVIQYDPDGSIDQSSKPISYSEMRKELQRLCDLEPSDQWSFSEDFSDGMSSQQLFYLARLGFAFGKGVIYFLVSLITVFFVTLVFSVIFKLFSAGGCIFSFSELWKIAIYAAFPVVFVVNAFPALQLPGTGYFSWLFMCGWIVYLFFVLRYLFLNPESEDDESNGGKENGIA